MFHLDNKGDDLLCIVQGTVVFADSDALHEALTVLENNGVVAEQGGVPYWFYDNEYQEPVYIEGNSLVIPTFEGVSEVFDVVQEILPNSTENDIKMVYINEDEILLHHIVNGEFEVNIEEFEELVEFFEMDAGDYDSEEEFSAALHDAIAEWFEEY